MSHKRELQSESVGGVGVAHVEGEVDLVLKSKSTLKSFKNSCSQLQQVPGPVILNCRNDVVDAPPAPVRRTTPGKGEEQHGSERKARAAATEDEENLERKLLLCCKDNSGLPSSGGERRDRNGLRMDPCNCQGSASVKSKPFFLRNPDYLVSRSVLLSGLLLLSSVAAVTGLQCYECLSLQCDSGMICDSIKDSITRTFVPNSHYIHFDPRILCPGPEVPTNSSEWDGVTFNCTRSDSLCLEAPVEVITSFDGSRDGKKLDAGSQMTSLGYLRGCANRRGLNELEVTISVRKIYMDNDTWEYFTLNSNSHSNNNNHNNHKNNHINRINNNNNHNPNKFESDYNTGSGNSHSSERYTDGYKITRVHYHEIYVDHGTANATRCYMDDCNNRKKLRIRSTGNSVSGFGFGPFCGAALIFNYLALSSLLELLLR